MRESTRDTLADLGRYTPTLIIPPLMGIVAVAVYTRILDPVEYGYYTLVFTTAVFVQTVAFGWLNQSSLRYYQRYKNAEKESYFSTCLLGFFFVSFG